MFQPSEKDVIQYTLQSYVGDANPSMNISNRQKEAIEKMMILPEDKFQELINSIVNEIHRRNNMPHTLLDNPMRDKLCKLKSEKFKSLVLDALLVYNYKSPDNKNYSGIDSLISDLEKVIVSLKQEARYEDIVIDKINGEASVLKKCLQFTKYVEKLINKDGGDVKVVNHMNDILRDAIAKESSETFEIVIDSVSFIRECDSSKFVDLPEYQYHRNNIRDLEKVRDRDLRDRLIQKEVACIIGVLQTHSRTAILEDSMAENVQAIIEQLELIKDMKVDDDTSLESCKFVLLDSTQKILANTELNKELSKNTLDKLKMQRLVLQESNFRGDFNMMISLIVSMACTVRCILEDIPTA